MGCPGDDHQLGARDAISDLLAVAAGCEDVLIADDHQRGDRDRVQRLGQFVIGCQYRSHLGCERVRRPPHRQWPEPAERRDETTKRTWRHHPSSCLSGHRAHPTLQGRLHPAFQQFAPPWLVVTRRAGQGQRQHTRRVANGHHLADRPTHRCADDVRRRQPSIIEHRNRVVGHLFDRVHAERFVAASRTAVVECNHPVVASQREALHVPTVLVGAEALNHQHRGRRMAAESLVVQAGAVGSAGVGHQPSANQSIGVTPVCRPPSPSISRWM